MKRIVLAAAALLAAVPATAATTITLGADGGFANVPTNLYSSIALNYNFNPGSDLSRFSTAPAITSTSSGGFFAAPKNDTTSYAYVSPSSGTTPTTLSLAGISFNQVSLYWGSQDDFNQLTFVGAGGVAITPTYTGTTFNGTANDDGGVSQYVTFTFDAATAATITGIRFASVGSSTNFGNAFEFDNLIIGTAGAVPEASTWAMMMVGLGMVGGTLRRRAKSTGKTLATA